MARVQTSIDIAAPVQDVWELVTDLQRLGDWVSIHRDFPESPPAEVTEGVSFRQTLAVAGTPFEVRWTAVEVDGPQRLRWEGTGPAGTMAQTTYSLSAASGVVAGHAEREADASLARLKQIAEG